MCSACSGDYTGGFEDPVDWGSGPDEDCFAAWRLPAESRRPSDPYAPGFAEANGVFTPHAVVTRIDEDTNRHDWEVLVSETQIIEVHNFGAVRGKDAEQTADKTAEMAEASEQSEAGRAKYYRTPGGPCAAVNRRPSISCPRLKRSPRPSLLGTSGCRRRAFEVPGVNAFIRRLWGAIRNQSSRSVRRALHYSVETPFETEGKLDKSGPAGGGGKV